MHHPGSDPDLSGDLLSGQPAAGKGNDSLTLFRTHRPAGALGLDLASWLRRHIVRRVGSGRSELLRLGGVDRGSKTGYRLLERCAFAGSVSLEDIPDVRHQVESVGDPQHVGCSLALAPARPRVTTAMPE